MEIHIRNNRLTDLSASLNTLEKRLGDSTTALQRTIRSLNLTGGDSQYTASAKASLQTRLNRETARAAAVAQAQKKIRVFAANTRTVDGQVARRITQTQDAFLNAHPWLRPEAEKPWYKRALDAIGEACRSVCGTIANGFKTALRFISDHLIEIEVAVGVVALAAAIALTVLSGGTLAGVGALLLNVAVTSLKTAVAGALICGTVGAAAGAFQNGWQGAGEGFVSGAKNGFIGGLAAGFAAGSVAVCISSVQTAVAFVQKGGVLTPRNFTVRTYSKQEVLATQRPGVLADNTVLPDKRVKHTFFGDRKGGGHALNLSDTGRSLQNATSLDAIPGQPKGVYDATFISANGKTSVKTCWPNSFSPKRILESMEQSYQMATGGQGLHLFTEHGISTYAVKLPDGMFSRIAINTQTGELITCFPEGTAANILKLTRMLAGK